jgi:hypothetical protein
MDAVVAEASLIGLENKARMERHADHQKNQKGELTARYQHDGA